MNYWLVRMQGWRNGGLNEAVEWGMGSRGRTSSLHQHLTVSAGAGGGSLLKLDAESVNALNSVKFTVLS